MAKVIGAPASGTATLLKAFLLPLHMQEDWERAGTDSHRLSFQDLPRHA
jgi:hypothetical protein